MRPNEATMEAPKPTLAAALEEENLTGSSSHGASRRQPPRIAMADPCRVQPPDAENRMSGGVEGSWGAIPMSPSNLAAGRGIKPLLV